MSSSFTEELLVATYYIGLIAALFLVWVIIMILIGWMVKNNG